MEALGVTSIYQAGGLLLILAGWGLLVTLFVVLEVVRGHKSGALQSVRVSIIGDYSGPWDAQLLMVV